MWGMYEIPNIVYEILMIGQNGTESGLVSMTVLTDDSFILRYDIIVKRGGVFGFIQGHNL